MLIIYLINIVCKTSILRSTFTGKMGTLFTYESSLTRSRPQPSRKTH